MVATEFHERHGLDLSAVPRMSAGDVVTASLRGLELGEVVCAAQGVEDTTCWTRSSAPTSMPSGRSAPSWRRATGPVDT